MSEPSADFTPEPYPQPEGFTMMTPEQIASLCLVVDGVKIPLNLGESEKSDEDGYNWTDEDYGSVPNNF